MPYNKYSTCAITGDALCRFVSLCSLIAILLLSGCGQTAEILTVHCDGRRVGASDADGGYIAYVWYPAQLISTQGHLVLLDSIMDSEVELEPDLNGPMAMCNGCVVWWNARARDKEGKSDVIVYDVDSRKKTAVAHAKVQGLDADGDHSVWAESYESFGSDIILYDIEAEQQQVISSGGREGDMTHRDPRIGDGTVAWEAYNRKTRESAIAIYDIDAGNLSSIAVSQAYPRVSVSGNRLVYCVKNGGEREIHLYDISAGNDRVIASLKRLATSPYIEGDRIAWCEHVTKDEFKGIPGQPLMDEEDIHDVFVYNINSGSKRILAKYLLTSGGGISIHDGRVYLHVYRDYPPPGSTNLIVPVDLWVW